MSIQIGPKINAMQSAALDDSYLSSGNQMLRMLQALVQPNVINVGGLTGPPASPNNGDNYVIGPSGATGAWAGQGNSVAYYASPTGPNPDINVAPGWDFYAPVEGWTVFNQNDGNQYRFSGPSGPWVAVVGASGISVNNQTGPGYTAALSDNGNLVSMGYTGATAAFVVPLNADVPFPIGATLAVEQTGPTGPGAVTITPATGAVTINTPSSLTTRAQYSIVGVIQNATNVWTAVGDLT